MLETGDIFMITVFPNGKQSIPSEDKVMYKVVKHWKGDNTSLRP